MSSVFPAKALARIREHLFQRQHMKVPRANTSAKYRKLVLRWLKKLYDEKGPNAGLLLDPPSVLRKPDVSREEVELYKTAIDQLIREDLIGFVVAKGENRPVTPEGYDRPLFRLNPDKLPDIKKALYWYHDPLYQWSIGIALAIIGAILAILKLFVI